LEKVIKKVPVIGKKKNLIRVHWRELAVEKNTQYEIRNTSYEIDLRTKFKRAGWGTDSGGQDFSGRNGAVRIAAYRTGGTAGSVGERSGASLHAFVAPQLFGRHEFLSARFLHDEA